MDIFPLIYIKYRKISGAIDGNALAINDLPELSDGNMIYIKDFDGTEKDAPNLEIYQKLADKNDLWVDADPRRFGDVVDIIMAGASRITIMKDLFPMKEIPNIKEVTDSMIYTNIDLEKDQEILFTPPQGIDGLVVFGDKSQTELLKTICSQYKVYVTETDEKNISYWKDIGVAGVLLDFEKFKLVNKDDI
jgi:hypothetical protein